MINRIPTCNRPRKNMVLAAVLTVLAFTAVGIGQAYAAATAPTTYSLLVSAKSGRSGATALDGSAISGPQYVFVGPLAKQTAIKTVTFRLDGNLVPGMANSKSIDSVAPFDLMGGNGSTAKAFNFTTLTAGSHAITADLLMLNGTHQLVSATFATGTVNPTTTTSTSTSTTVAPTTTTTVPVTTTTSTTVAPTTTTTAPVTTTTVPSGGTGRTYPLHTNIVSTTFWVGEIFNATLADGSQVCSTYDSQWALHWSGVNSGTVPASAAGCAGSVFGGCDGVAGANNTCATQVRTAANGYFPTQGSPKENPFYLDLPFDDLNDATGFSTRCSVIPWANDPGYAGHCTDTSFSYMKNKFVKMTGPNGNTCYGQIEDAGPSHGSLYHDTNYVFGANNAQPVQGQFNNAGADVSPALNGCLGFAELDGQSDHISWSFVDTADVPAGPWTQIVTTSGVTE